MTNGIPARRITYTTYGITALILLLTFVFGSTQTMMVNGENFTDSFWLRITDMFVNSSLLFTCSCSRSSSLWSDTLLQKGTRKMMFRKRERRKVPILNTTSTADISFMLLIFFLVASSMDLDKGLSRQLPAIDKTKTPPAAVDSRKVMRIVIDAKNQVTLDGKAVTMKELLQRATLLIKLTERGILSSYRVAVTLHTILISTCKTN